MEDVAGRLERINSEIEAACRAAGRARDEVCLLAVSKFQDTGAIEAAAMAGQSVFGENYVQEALAKQSALANFTRPLSWHMIGHVQTRKAKDVAGRFTLVHSLDSIKLASALEKQMNAGSQKALIEVNFAGDGKKTGIAPAEAGRLLEYVLKDCPHLDVRGLMGMAPVYDAGDAARPYFSALRELRDRLEMEYGTKLPELSMGMSGDFKAAIEEGATIVRIGTAIFGPRPRKT